MFSIPVDETTVHHCQLLPECAQSGYESYRLCKTNPGHTNFFTVDEFEMKHLPQKYQTEECEYFIQNLINRTVKISVNFTSNDRPGTFPDSCCPYPFYLYRGDEKCNRCGTGFVDSLYKHHTGSTSCPCPSCKASEEPKMEYWEFEVSTVTHVILDKSESERSVIELFYDSDDKKGVEYLYGMNVLGKDLDRRVRTDACTMLCVTHEALLAERLIQLCSLDDGRVLENMANLTESFNSTEQWLWNCGILVSHPHGISKRISLGNFHHRRYAGSISNSLVLAQGTRIVISFSKDKQENIDPCDPDAGVINPPLPGSDSSHKPPVQSPREENPEMDDKVKQQENASQKLHDLFQEFFERSDNGGYLTTRFDTRAIPPYLPETDTLTETKGVSVYWHTLPAGTTIVSPEGSSLVLPMETKFTISDREHYHTFFHPTYITYDMATCTGSSGARVTDCTVVFSNLRHFGRSEGKNRSGLNTF